MMYRIDTKAAPAAIGPYSQAYVVNSVIYTSGQIPIDPSTGEIAGPTIREQAEQVCKNVGSVLDAAGSSFAAPITYINRINGEICCAFYDIA